MRRALGKFPIAVWCLLAFGGCQEEGRLGSCCCAGPAERGGSFRSLRLTDTLKPGDMLEAEIHVGPGCWIVSYVSQEAWKDTLLLFPLLREGDTADKNCWRNGYDTLVPFGISHWLDPASWVRYYQWRPGLADSQVVRPVIVQK